MKTSEHIKLTAAVVVMVCAVVTMPYIAIPCVILGTIIGTINATAKTR